MKIVTHQGSALRLIQTLNTSLCNYIHRFISFYTIVKLCVCECSIKNYLLY